MEKKSGNTNVGICEEESRKARLKRKKAKRRKEMMLIFSIFFAMIVIVGGLGIGIIKYFQKLEEEAGKTKVKKEHTTLDDSILNEDSSTEEVNGIEFDSGMWINGDLYEPDDPKSDAYFADVCFIGDSRTKGMLEFSDLPAYHGFYEVGYTAKKACTSKIFSVPGHSGKYNLLEAIEKCDDNIFYLAFGVNDMGSRDINEYTDDMKKIIEKIIDTHPDSIIYVENILPVGANFERRNPTFSNARMAGYNDALYSLCKEYGNLIYLDVASVVVGEYGAADDEYVTDGLHFNRTAYALIREYIKNNTVKMIAY